MSSASPTSADQQFLDDLDQKLWNAADCRRSNLNAAVYKDAVLGLILSEWLDGRQEGDPRHEYS